MKIPVNIHQPRKAFSLIELLVVITIIAALSGLMVAAMGPAKQRMTRSKTKGLIEVIKTGLEQYYAEYGVYPINESEDEGGRILYKHLFGDFNDNPLPDWHDSDEGDSSVKTFVNKFQPPQLDENNQPIGENSYVTNARGDWEVVDAWGEPFQYYNYRPGQSRDAPNGGGKHNPKYDLFSIGGDEDPADDNRSMWIKNW